MDKLAGYQPISTSNQWIRSFAPGTQTQQRHSPTHQLPIDSYQESVASQQRSLLPPMPNEVRKVYLEQNKATPQPFQRPSDRPESRNEKEIADLSFQSLNKYLRTAYAFLAILIFAVGGWAYFSQLKGAVVATGSVAVEGKPKIVQHLDGGIISEILVADGDFVEKDTLLMKLDSTIIAATHLAAETTFFENEALISRLQAEKEGREKILWSPYLLNHKTNNRVRLALKGQEQLFYARKTSLSGRTKRLEQRISKLLAEAEGRKSEINFTNSELNIVIPELNKYKAFLQKGLISRSRVIDLERDKTRLQNQVSQLESHHESILNSIKETEIEIDQMREVRVEEILTELRQAQTQADNFSQNLKAASNKTSHIEIKAPSAGVVHNMLVTTIGGIIAPGQEVMRIIPENEQLIIKAKILPQDIDQVSLGQNTTILFSMLNQKTPPELVGAVKNISADTLLDQIQGFPYYAVEIEVAETELTKLNGQKLIAGMPADVFIQTNSRSVLDYLLEPVRDALSKTMRDS